MFAGDIYTQTSQSLGYPAGDWGQMGWSLKPRYSASVKTGNWVEETAPPSPPRPIEMVSTAHASFRGESSGDAAGDTHLRSLAQSRDHRGNGVDALYALSSPPATTSVYGSSFTFPASQQATARAFDRKSSRWLPEPVDTMPVTSNSTTFGQTAKLRWFQQSAADEEFTTTTRASYPTPPATASPTEKRFARSQQFSRHLLLGRSLR